MEHSRGVEAGSGRREGPGLGHRASEVAVAKKKKPKSSAPRENELSEKFPESSAAKIKPQKIPRFFFIIQSFGFFFLATL